MKSFMASLVCASLVIFHHIHETYQYEELHMKNNVELGAGPVEDPSDNLEAEYKAEAAGRKDLSSNSDEGVGVTTYVRYGHFKCRKVKGTSLVYTGYAVGTHYLHPGGGLGPICLPDPKRLPLQYLEVQPGWQNMGLLYGTEYETAPIGPLNDVHNMDVPCTVCLVRGRTAQLTIPGRTSCPSGWTLEYKGYLMSDYHGHKSPNKFVCVDFGMKPIRGSGENFDGQLLYTIEIASSPQLCSVFECTGKEITCAVCTI